jgi:outer membrane immunogenic protein
MVLGFETDIQTSGERGSGNLVAPFSIAPCVLGNATLGCLDNSVVLSGTTVTGYTTKIDWFGTLRARLGLLLTPQVMLYATGGLAYGHVSIAGNTVFSSSFGPATFPTTPVAAAFSASTTNVGFAVGGGIESKCSYWLPAGWTWKAEYLYVDLGSLDAVDPFAGQIFVTGRQQILTVTETISTHTRFTDNIVRVGLNYKFGYAAAPVYK